MGKALEQMEKFTRALNKSPLIAAGFSYDDLQKSIIAIANSWYEFNHGHTIHRELAEQVKKGVRQAGGTPMEFNAPWPCDGLGNGNREYISNLDGLLLVYQDKSDLPIQGSR